MTIPEDRRTSGLRVDLPPMQVYLIIDEKKVLYGHATNISLSGIRINTNAKCEAGRVLSLEFRLPGTTEAITCRSCIRWCHDLSPSPNLMGLEFIEISLNSVKQIRGYMNKNAVPTGS